MDTTHCQAGHSGFACVPAGHAQAAVAAADGHTRRCRQVGRVRRSTNTSRFQYLLAIRPWVHWALWAYHTCIHEADVHACTADNSFCQNCSLPDLNQSQHRASFTLHGQCGCGVLTPTGFPFESERGRSRSNSPPLVKSLADTEVLPRVLGGKIQGKTSDTEWNFQLTYKLIMNFLACVLGLVLCT